LFIPTKIEYNPFGKVGREVKLLFTSEIVSKVEGKEVIMTKDTKPINLVAKKWHEIESLEDGTVFVNIFAENKY
jgi:hypothetical protein